VVPSASKPRRSIRRVTGLQDGERRPLDQVRASCILSLSNLSGHLSKTPEKTPAPLLSNRTAVVSIKVRPRSLALAPVDRPNGSGQRCAN
jgi:hypothetical protein